MSRRELQRSQVSPKRRDAGFGLWAITTNLVFLGLLSIAALRMAPTYFEYLAVKDILLRAVVEQPCLARPCRNSGIGWQRYW